MSPTSFVFTLTMPGDARLVGAIRLLAVQAATYAQLPDAKGSALASQAERAAETAIAASRSPNGPIDFRFSGDEKTVTIAVSFDAVPSAQLPRSASADGVSVDWSAEGSRQTCHIRQPMPA
jgi:hypothetical protein